MVDQVGALGAITVTETTGATITHLSGEIDEAVRGQASDALSVMLRRGLPMVLDTTGVTFIDSMGIAFLIQCSRFGTDQGVTVTLPDPPENVALLLEIAGAAPLFDLPPAPAGAFAAAVETAPRASAG